MGGRRRLLAMALLASAHPAQAQEAPPTPEIGLLLNGTEQATAPFVAAFRGGLAAHGLLDGQGVRLVLVSLTGPAGFDTAAQSLPARPAVVVGAGVAEVRWLAQRYPATPVVMVAVGDPVGIGLVESLERPGGRITGLSDFRPAFAEARLRLARDVLPRPGRVGFLHNPEATSSRFGFEAAQRLDIALVPLVARNPAELAAAIGRIKAAAMDAVVVVPNPLTFGHRQAIAAQAAREGVPVIFGYPEFMDLAPPAAGLASLGADLGELYLRAAGYTARIIAGADPANLPVGGPEREMLVIDRRIAHGLGLQVPDAWLQRAGRIFD